MLARVLTATISSVLVALAASAGPERPPSMPKLPPVTIAHFLPVHTQTMRPGVFQAQRRRTGVSRPFFLVGCDAYSLKWLAKNRDRLVALHAFGLVVEASNAAAYRRVEAATKGLIVRPVSADLIAQHLGVTRYPALITSEGIFP